MGAKDQGADNITVQKRWKVVPRTLCFITYQDQLLLMKRAPHKRVFPNHYNGVGGHIERYEDPITSAIREIKEETGLDVHNVRYCGSTHIDAGEDNGIMLFIFTAEALQKKIIDSEEGTLHWLPITEVLRDIRSATPQLKLVEDLPILLSLIFEDNAIPFFAHVSYDKDDQIIFRLQSP